MQYDDTSLFAENWSRAKLLGEYVIQAENANYYRHKFTGQCAETADVRRDAEKRAYEKYHDDRIRNARIYTDAIIEDSLRPLNALIYQVGQLGDRAGTAQVIQLKATAERAKQRVNDARPSHSDAAQRAWDLRCAEATRTRPHPTS